MSDSHTDILDQEANYFFRLSLTIVFKNTDLPPFSLIMFPYIANMFDSQFVIYSSLVRGPKLQTVHFWINEYSYLNDK